MKTARILLAACLCLTAAACGKKGPLIIGLVGDIRSDDREAQSGFRNGAALAVEHVNDAGGVGGRPLQLVTGNDQGDPALVERVDQRLIASGAVALLGHNTSATTAAALPVLERHKILLFGPEATSSEFAGKKDYFMRNEVREQVFAEVLAEYAAKTMKLKSVGAVIDARNRPFSKPYFDAFQNKMKALGADAELLYAYQNPDVVEAGRQVAAFLSRGGDAILLVSDGTDTRHLTDMVRRVRATIPILASPWAIPPSSRIADPPPPEDLIFPTSWDPDSRSETFAAFQRNYQQRFSRLPDYHAMHSYEAVKILAQALGKARGNPKKLPQTIVQIGTFNGLQGPIRIDPFGDAERAVYVIKTTRNGATRLHPRE